jgi:hypothetical protein
VAPAPAGDNDARGPTTDASASAVEVGGARAGETRH